MNEQNQMIFVSPVSRTIVDFDVEYSESIFIDDSIYNPIYHENTPKIIAKQTLPEMELCRTHINNTTFIDCDFRKVDFIEATLLSCAFINCNFANVDLSLMYAPNSKFRECDFTNAAMPPATDILKWDWFDDLISYSLRIDLMAYDRDNHMTPDRFKEWKEDGRCPYIRYKFARDANFSERRDLYDHEIPSKPAYELVERLFMETDNKLF